MVNWSDNHFNCYTSRWKLRLQDEDLPAGILEESGAPKLHTKLIHTLFQNWFFTFFISTHLPTFALVRLVACAARLDIFLAWACYIVYVYLVEMLIVVEPATHSLAFLSSLLHKLGLPFKVQQSLADCFFFKPFSCTPIMDLSTYVLYMQCKYKCIAYAMLVSPSKGIILNFDP